MKYIISEFINGNKNEKTVFFVLISEKKENIAFRENKKLGEGCFEHILHLIFFPRVNHGGWHDYAFTFKLLSQFANKSGWNVC